MSKDRSKQAFSSELQLIRVLTPICFLIENKIEVSQQKADASRSLNLHTGCWRGRCCGLFPLLFGRLGGRWKDFWFQDRQLVGQLKVVYFV